MELDPVLLSRLQFAFVIAFHILLPAFTVGLASYIAVLEGLHFWKRDATYLRLSLFWTRIFAVSFGMGVVSGIVMPFQFGTNWSGLADTAGNVLAPLLTYEGLIAFFLEAGIPGHPAVRPQARRRRGSISSPRVMVGIRHAVLVVLDPFRQQLDANAGRIRNHRRPILREGLGRRDLQSVVPLPDCAYGRRLLRHHGFVVLAVSRLASAATVNTFRIRNAPCRWGWASSSCWCRCKSSLGDAHGLNTLEYQPAKVAAMEGLWNTQRRAPAVLFAIPDATREANDYEIAVPGLASIYLTHDVDGEVKGLKAFRPEDRPPVAIVFWAFRIMVGMGMLMLAVAAWGAWLRLRNRLFSSTAFLLVCNFMAPAGFIAVLSGWTVTEVGRQPWVVHGLLRTKDAVSPSITGLDVLLSLLLYIAVYAVIFSAGLYYLFRIARAGPPAEAESRDARLTERPARPLSAADA